MGRNICALSREVCELWGVLWATWICVIAYHWNYLGCVSQKHRKPKLIIAPSTIMHMLRTDLANKLRDAESTGSCMQHMHNSPECRPYRWSITIKNKYGVLKGPHEHDIVRPPTPIQIIPDQSYRPLLRFIREFNPASQEILSVLAGEPCECRPLA